MRCTYSFLSQCSTVDCPWGSIGGPWDRKLWWSIWKRRIQNLVTSVCGRVALIWRQHPKQSFCGDRGDRVSQGETDNLNLPDEGKWCKAFRREWTHLNIKEGCLMLSREMQHVERHGNMVWVGHQGGLTECSAEPFRHGGFARIDFRLWLRGSRQFFHWQKMCPESKSDGCTRLRPQGFPGLAVFQTPVFCLAKTVESTCPLWSPVRNADIRSSLLTQTHFSSGLAKAPELTLWLPLTSITTEWALWHFDNFDNSPNTPKNVPRVENPHELIVCGGRVKISRFFVYKKSVGDPNKFDVLRPHHKLIQTRFPFKRQSWILPKLSKIHV